MMMMILLIMTIVATKSEWGIAPYRSKSWSKIPEYLLQSSCFL